MSQVVTKFGCLNIDNGGDTVMSSNGWTLHRNELFVVEKEEERLFCVVEKGCVVCVFVASREKTQKSQ